MEAAAVEHERLRGGVGAGLERAADQDRVVAADELLVELAREPRDRAAENGDAVDELVSDAGELLLSGRLRREPPRDVLLPAARTLMQKRPELRTASSVFEE